MFIFCCEQALPGEDSREVCQQAATNLRRVLDRILDPQAAAQQAPMDTSDPTHAFQAGLPVTTTTFNDIVGLAQTQSHLESTATGLAGDVDFSNWFDNMSWTMGPTDSATGWTSNNGLTF